MLSFAVQVRYWLVYRCHQRLGIEFDSFLSATQKSGRKDASFMQARLQYLLN